MKVPDSVARLRPFQLCRHPQLTRLKCRLLSPGARAFEFAGAFGGLGLSAGFCCQAPPVHALQAPSTNGMKVQASVARCLSL